MNKWMVYLGTKITLRKRLEPNYPDGLNTRLMFLNFPSGNKSEASGRKKKRMALLENFNTTAGYEMDYRLNT